MSKNKKRLYQHITLLCILLAGAGFGCPIYELSGICCPLCGTTRAWICLLTGRATLAFQYHPFFLITPFFFFAAVHYSSLFRKNRGLGFFLICTALLLAIYNLLRLTGTVSWPG